MTGPTHILFGVATGISLCRGFSLHMTAIELLCLFLGSLGPDVDADSGSINKPGRLFRGFLPRGVANFLDEMGALVSAIARSISGHRGFFHTPLVGLTITGAGLAFKSSYLLWFSAGYLSHILADACTVRGVPLLWPLRAKEYSLAKVRTGSSRELFVAAGLGFFVIFAGWPLLPESTRQGFVEMKQSVLKRQGRSSGR